MAINHKGLCTGNKNNNVLIKEIIAGLIQPEWVQRPWGSSPMGPERDSWVFMLGSSARPATMTSALTSGLTVIIGKNIGQNIVWCSLMWFMPLRSLSNCDYELKNLPRLILGPIHSNQVMGTDPVGSHHGTRNSRSNSINPTYPYQSHD